MPYLLKSEPTKYSFDDLVRDKETVWDGISNAQALGYLRGMKKGEKLVIYHSNEGKEADRHWLRWCRSTRPIRKTRRCGSRPARLLKVAQAARRHARSRGLSKIPSCFVSSAFPSCR